MVNVQLYCALLNLINSLEMKMKMKKRNLIRIIISCCIIIVILAMSIHRDIQYSRQYLALLFDNFSIQLQNVGADNVEHAQQAQDVLSGITEMDIDARDLSPESVHYFPDRNEYGFNQGEYSSVAANGTLIGYGQPPTDITKNSKRFLIYDKLWNNFNRSNTFNNYFVANYKFQYIYSSRLRNAKNRKVYLNKNSLTNKAYRLGLDKTYQTDLDKNGYFFSLPFNSLLDGEQVISVVSPIYLQGEHVIDMGTDIYLSTLKKMIFIYPEFKNFINVDLNFHHSDITIPISQGKYFYWEIFDYSYDISNLGTLTAEFDVLYFVKQSYSLFFMLVVLAVLVNMYLASLNRHREEKSYLNQQIVLDPMTGLYNRRILDLDVEAALQQKHSLDQSVWIITIDANKFKQINDKYGHQMGDKAIEFISQVIISCTRETDYCIRMGGDEFLILLPDMSLSQITDVAERIENRVESTSVAAIGISVTITMAYTQIHPDESFDDAYKRVDDDLYIKKGNTLRH